MADIYGGMVGDVHNGTPVDDRIYGGGGNDTITGNEGNDLIYGGDGDDRIDGNAGNDTIDGGAGNDSVHGGDGDDVIYVKGRDYAHGDAGNDLFIIENRSDLVFGTGPGTRTVIYGEDGNDTIQMDLALGDELKAVGSTAFNLAGLGQIAVSDVEAIAVANSTANGSAHLLDLAGNDTFALDSQLNGTVLSTIDSLGVTKAVNDDLLAYDTATGVVDGNDTSHDYTAGIRINGELYEDSDMIALPFGGELAVMWDWGTNSWHLDYLRAETNLAAGTTLTMGERLSEQEIIVEFKVGANWVKAKIDIGFDVDAATLDLSGVINGQKVIANDAGSTIQDGRGNDTILGGIGDDTITLGNSTVPGTDSNNVNAGAGDDTIISYTNGNNFIVGGEGHDYIEVHGNGNDQIWAGADDAGNDTIYIYGDGNKQIGTGAGDDLVVLDQDGDANNNSTVSLGAGNDEIQVYSDGSNKIWAGADNDLVDVLGDGNNVIGLGIGDDDIEIYGDGNNTVYANIGDDDIHIHGEGDNLIYAGGGNDTIYAYGDGDSTIFGGDGDDTIEIYGDGDNLIFAGADDDWIGIDADGNNTIDAGDGNDAIDIDGDGNNFVIAGAGNDTIYAYGEGDNTVQGGAGNDTFFIDDYATGANILSGGAGTDTFLFDGSGFGTSTASATMVFDQNSGSDFVYGFDAFSGTQKLDLSAFNFDNAQQVLDLMSDGSLMTTIMFGAGNTVSFIGLNKGILAAADPADWLIL